MDSALTPGKNSYLEAVLEQQQRVEDEIRPRKTGGIEVRITGAWWWRTVVVPPNVYVVHTRRGHEGPVHVGLGLSFRYNPRKDAFLLVPAAMQTILINARCICAERQGILVQAYVQWIVEDIETAYRKLDFSDRQDPMRLVNVQLREQAEAAIKDKVATLRIDEVLSDKRPIIDELTHRLREVAEGGGAGLGLKIVTVQIKEAVVSSARLWENMQSPFRAEQHKLARLSGLIAERAVGERELLHRQQAEVARIQTEEELARLSHQKDIDDFDRRQIEEQRRYQVQQEAEQQRMAERTATEIVRRETGLQLYLRELELQIERARARLRELEALEQADEAEGRRALQRAMRELDLSGMHHTAAHEREQKDLENLRLRHNIENRVSRERLDQLLLPLLPQIVEKLPAPARLEQVHISSGGGAADGVATLVGALQGLRSLFRGRDDDGGEAAEPK